jgi:hypothetical protein
LLQWIAGMSPNVLGDGNRYNKKKYCNDAANDTEK